MAMQVSTSFVRQYEREVHEVYQRKGSKLMMTIRRKPNVVGTSTTFQKIGKGSATTKSRHGTITPMNQDHTAVVCTMSDFYAGDYVDKLDENKITHDEKRVIVTGGAYALGRKTDELIITQMDTTSTTNTTATRLTLAKIQASMRTLGDNDVFEGGRMFAILPWYEWANDLLSIQQFASSDYSGNLRPFLAGTESKRWLGTDWMPHSGLEDLVSGSTAKSFWYHEDALGWGYGQNVMTDISWVGERAAHWVNNMMSGGAALIDGDGCIEIQTTRT